MTECTTDFELMLKYRDQKVVAMRKAFEAYIGKFHGSLEIVRSPAWTKDGYSLPGIQDAWQCWKAAWRASARTSTGKAP